MAYTVIKTWNEYLAWEHAVDLAAGLTGQPTDIRRQANWSSLCTGLLAIRSAAWRKGK